MSAAATYDLVIRNGLIVDGSGDAPFRSDVGIVGDRITAVGSVEGAGAEEIDAKGCIVTPGFVDIHTHYDGQAIWSQYMTPSSSHGVTTVVMGNCGVGFAPCRPEDHQLLIRVMEGVEDIPGVVMAEGLPWTWETFPEYLDALDARPRDIDVAAYVPHSPLRVYVMGERGANRESATANDLARMRALAREAIDAGAIGFASSRLFLHRTKDGEQIPSYAAPAEELREIAGGLADAGSGTIQLVLNIPDKGWEEEVEQMVNVVKSSGRPATFTMGTSNAGPRIWDAAMDGVTRANAEGAAITAQILPRPVGMIAGLELSVNPFALCPTFLAMAHLSFKERLAAMRRPEVRARLLGEKPQEGNPLAVQGRMWDRMFPLGDDTPRYEPPLDTSIAAQAAAQDRSPEEVAYDYLIAGDGKAKLYLTLGNFHEGKLDAIHELLHHPHAVTGLGDGGAHYGVICDASYPTFMLTYWTRDRDGPRLTLPHAIRHLTSAPAAAVGLNDRGFVKPGYKADINIINQAQLKLHSPEVVYDLPAGGRRLDQGATGYVATIVSGEVIRRNDQSTGALPGRLVRGAR